MVMEAHGWTWQEYCDAPYDLIDEAMTRLNKRTLEENRKAKTPQR